MIPSILPAAGVGTVRRRDERQGAAHARGARGDLARAGDDHRRESGGRVGSPGVGPDLVSAGKQSVETVLTSETRIAQVVEQRLITTDGTRVSTPPARTVRRDRVLRRRTRRGDQEPAQR